MMRIDHERSEQLARLMVAHPGVCWLAAWRGVTEHLQDAFYIEGWVIDAVSPADVYTIMEHGWIEQDETIIDPALFQAPCAAYFPALRFSRAQAVKLGVSGCTLPVMRRDNRTADQRAAIDRALKEAIEAAERLAAADNKPIVVRDNTGTIRPLDEFRSTYHV